MCRLTWSWMWSSFMRCCDVLLARFFAVAHGDDIRARPSGWSISCRLRTCPCSSFPLEMTAVEWIAQLLLRGGRNVVVVHGRLRNGDGEMLLEQVGWNLMWKYRYVVDINSVFLIGLVLLGALVGKLLTLTLGLWQSFHRRSRRRSSGLISASKKGHELL